MRPASAAAVSMRQRAGSKVMSEGTGGVVFGTLRTRRNIGSRSMEGKVQKVAVRPFRPAIGLAGAHAQTIAGRYLRRPALPQFERERIELPDGDFVDLDHMTCASLSDDAPVVLLMHGLEGSARRGYAINTYRALEQH